MGFPSGSEVARSLVAAKTHLQSPFRSALGDRRRPLVVHVEAGLRSLDDDMPEEINRKLTDTISDLLFVTDPAGMTHLRAAGVDSSRVFFVGNVMIDTLRAAEKQAMKSPVLEQLGLQPQGYGLLTLHRPSNVDQPTKLRELLETLADLCGDMPLVFPVHPRTRARLDAAGLELQPPLWRVCEPVGYLDFLKLMACANLVLTDSGGIQEETTVLGVPCLTLRENTERPMTVEQGTNVMAGTDPTSIRAAFHQLRASPPPGRLPDLWDGRAAERISTTVSGLLPSPGSFAKSQALSLVGRLPPATSLLASRL